MIKVITTRDKIKDVARGWYENFRQEIHGTSSSPAKDIKDIYVKLLALDLEMCPEEEITSIMGNDKWTKLICDNCEKEVDDVVEIDDDPDEEYKAPTFCFDCIKEAYGEVVEKENRGDAYYLRARALAAQRDAEREANKRKPVRAAPSENKDKPPLLVIDPEGHITLGIDVPYDPTMSALAFYFKSRLFSHHILFAQLTIKL